MSALYFRKFERRDIKVRGEANTSAGVYVKEVSTESICTYCPLSSGSVTSNLKAQIFDAKRQISNICVSLSSNYSMWKRRSYCNSGAPFCLDLSKQVCVIEVVVKIGNIYSNNKPAAFRTIFKISRYFLFLDHTFEFDILLTQHRTPSSGARSLNLSWVVSCDPRFTTFSY
jgi:hypothetical protein